MRETWDSVNPASTKAAFAASYSSSDGDTESLSERIVLNQPLDYISVVQVFKPGLFFKNSLEGFKGSGVVIQ
jgi:hypothetical protein